MLQVSFHAEAGIVKICVLASSSSGNATFIGTGETRILVDAGLSRKELFKRLGAIGEDPGQIDAIVVTHEHSDHVCGLARVAKALGVPVYMTRLTAPCIDWEQHEPKLETFQAGSRFHIGDIEIESFTVPHDAADPVGFCFQAAGVKVGLVTDLGYIPDSIKFHLRGSDVVILESNHDVEMLKVGPYPWFVKQRVMGRKGHLSNDAVADFICMDLDATTGTLVLGHLSEHNNYPDLVHLVATQALRRRSLNSRLVIAAPGAASEVLQF